MNNRRRVDDPTAIVDWAFAHGSLLVAIAVCALAIVVPSMRGALRAASLIGAICAVRLCFHPLRFAMLSRVYVDRGGVLIASILGEPRAVEVVRLEHDEHSPWPCVLHLRDGGRATFVARRDQGLGALFDLEPSDRARYERPSDARESLTDIEIVARR